MKKIYLSLLFLSLISIISCNESDEFGLKADLTFINSTDSNISYTNIPSTTLFELEPDESYTLSINTESTIEKPDIRSCCQGILEGFQGDFNQVYLVIDEVNCLYFTEGEGPTELANFESNKISDRKFSYTYSFTNESVASMQLCGN